MRKLFAWLLVLWLFVTTCARLLMLGAVSVLRWLVSIPFTLRAAYEAIRG